MNSYALDQTGGAQLLFPSRKANSFSYRYILQRGEWYIGRDVGVRPSSRRRSDRANERQEGSKYFSIYDADSFALAIAFNLQVSGGAGVHRRE